MDHVAHMTLHTQITRYCSVALLLWFIGAIASALWHPMVILWMAPSYAITLNLPQPSSDSVWVVAWLPIAIFTSLVCWLLLAALAATVSHVLSRPRKRNVMVQQVV